MSNSDPNDFDGILKENQKTFIAEAIDVRKFIDESHEFRKKFEFFLNLNKHVINIENDKSNDVLDKGISESIGLRTESMSCAQFNPIED